MQKQEQHGLVSNAGTRELFKSMFSFSWAQSLFGVKQLGGLLTPARSAGEFDQITKVTESELSEPVKNFFRLGDRMQRETVDILCGGLSAVGSGNTAHPASQGGSIPAQPSVSSPRPSGSEDRPANYTQDRPAYKVNSGSLNTSSFVVLGEGLAAGMGDFTLSEVAQRESFPAQMARQMQIEFSQALIQEPGICYPIGFTRPPVLVPQPSQSTVFDRIPPVPVRNLSVPGLRIKEALELRPVQPLIRRDSHKLTALNLTLGVLHIARGEEKTPTQLEYALECCPTFVVICLGYSEALEAIVTCKPDILPEVQSFCADYARLLSPLREAGAEVLVLTIPDPLDTAYVSTLNTASKILMVEPPIIRTLYGIGDEALITVHGLNEIGFQLFGKNVGPLPENSTLSVELGQQISRHVAELNDALISVTRECGAKVYDLCAFLRRVKSDGVNTGARKLTADYLGGFYSLNGYYPGATGHAVIANELLHALNLNYRSDFPQINLDAVRQSDPVAAYKQAEGPRWTLDNLPRAQPVPKATGPEEAALGGSTFAGASSAASQPSDWVALGAPEGEAPAPLRLPPNLEQTLPLNKAASYFGDGISAVNCRDPRSIQFGSLGSWLFGGLAMVDSHLSGNLRIRFTPPENNVTRFEISFEGGFAGEDAVLTTPQFFKMWFQQARVDEVPGLVSSGKVDLTTGLISDLQVYAAYSSTALFALVGSNPNWPRVPIIFKNESSQQYYGSAWARFEQRADGLLDFTFYGSMFAPVGPIVWPLNFVGPSGQFATIPAAGTVMHPHLHLSTKEPARGGECPDIPFNTIHELTLFTHNSSFGDAFTLHAPQLGGKATGRSHLLGRLLLQFGVPTGNSVPVAVFAVSPGGVMEEMESSPITQVFPGRLYPGPIGFDEFLRFPLRTYSLDDLAIIDDPFDISVGAVDLRTGRFLNELLHRGFINQDLIFALLRVEPRTPGSSFLFRGPAVLEKGPGGQPLFRFKGEVFVPYPEGFLFPSPNLTTGFPIGPQSRLDPFLWLHAIPDQRAGDYVKTGEGRNITSSAGEQFSYRYSIPNDQSKRSAVFEYENHTQQGKFRLHSLAWVGFTNSKGSEGKSTSRKSVEYDTLSFTCFGVWSKDGVETLVQASAQFSTSAERPYIGIQVDSGIVSNVNTKPPNIKDALP